ncbi:MAG: type II toxin-antitoxin system HipA family toxin [Alphaproteobacteria bacterium]|nr:type II toxin-antitoxin system HipA family toxin [Alphaproteobacteria bacterium]
MTSDPFTTECYVYITLPGQTNPVTAGRFTLKTDRTGIPTGRFVYGKSYLARQDAVPIDPIQLKLTSQVYETVQLNGVFGALRDAGPDYWGRHIIERHEGKPQLGEMDYLLYSPDDRAGALAFGLNQIPPAPKRTFNKTLDLEKLQAFADAVVKDDKIPLDSAYLQVADLMVVGTSMGGARPKAIVEDKDGLWLAKFNRFDDRWNSARVEHAMLVLARACGLNTPTSRIVTIGEGDVLLVKRFDREKVQDGYLRARMISALTLLRAEDTFISRDKWSYIVLAEELRRISDHPSEDAAELFRRMCFNALISNIDDHPRNHAFIAKDTEWRLSPAYDLTPAVPISLERRDLAMICGDEGRIASAENILSQHSRFLLNEDQAELIVKTMHEYIHQNWYGTCRSSGISERDCDLISGAFAYPGFY